MKKFNEEIKRIKNKRILLAILALILTLLIFIFAIIEIIPKNTNNYVEFRKDEKFGNLAKTTVYYLIGPVLKVTDTKDNSSSNYYIAVGDEKSLFIIRLKDENLQIPVLGKDVEKNETDELEGIEVYGSVELSSGSLRNALNNSLNVLIGEKMIDNENYDELLGGYHLDTISLNKNNSGRLFIIGICFLAIGVAYILVNKRTRENVDRNINELQSKGKLEDVINEFEGGQLIFYNGLKVYLSPNYIFSELIGFDVIAFKDIKDVNVSKKELMNRNKNKFIIITTKDDKEYYIAPIRKKKQKAIFNELLGKIRTKI